MRAFDRRQLIVERRYCFPSGVSAVAITSPQDRFLHCHPTWISPATIIGCRNEAGRAENALHRQWLDSDPSQVQPMFEDDVNGKADHYGDTVIQLHGWRRGNHPLRTPPERHTVSNRPH
jgi:hypothetical protein